MLVGDVSNEQSGCRETKEGVISLQFISVGLANNSTNRTVGRLFVCWPMVQGPSIILKG